MARAVPLALAVPTADAAADVPKKVVQTVLRVAAVPRVIGAAPPAVAVLCRPVAGATAKVSEVAVPEVGAVRAIGAIGTVVPQMTAGPSAEQPARGVKAVDVRIAVTVDGALSAQMGALTAERMVAPVVGLQTEDQRRAPASRLAAELRPHDLGPPAVGQSRVHKVVLETIDPRVRVDALKTGVVTTDVRVAIAKSAALSAVVTSADPVNVALVNARL